MSLWWATWVIPDKCDQGGCIRGPGRVVVVFDDERREVMIGCACSLPQPGATPPNHWTEEAPEKIDGVDRGLRKIREPLALERFPDEKRKGAP